MALLKTQLKFFPIYIVLLKGPVAQQLLSTPDEKGSNPVICNFKRTFIFFYCLKGVNGRE